MDEQEIQRLQGLITAMGSRIASLEARPTLGDHLHNGFDVSRIKYADISTKIDYIHHTIQGTDAATATNYGVFWTAPFACFVSGFTEVHQTAGTAGGTVSLTLEKLTGTTAPDSGSDLLNAALSLKATANTVQTGVLTQTTSRLSISKGDRLCMKDSGTLTNVANVTVYVEITIP
jgi:hypothetical protein